MKFSLNTIRHINSSFGCAGDPAPEGVEVLLERIGAQLGGIEEVEYIGARYDRATIVRIVDVADHPDADRLHVCQIDDGGSVQDVTRQENGLVQVVCGAPNVRAGMTVVWLPPGATVPSSHGAEPFVLGARELRGVTSNGMLASAKELAIGDSHEGILEITESVDPGTAFGNHYGLTDDVIIDIENKMFTHRPDCFGWLGLAREIAGIQGQEFHSPEWYRADAGIPESSEGDVLRVELRNEIPGLVPRFLVVPMAGVTVGPSPVWLQTRLSRVGLRPINNIVDLTNFFMLVTGQPLHAYDYDKVLAQDGSADHATIVVRHPHDGEKLTLLNGKEIEPRDEAVMIATNTKAIGLGGVMGGGDTEVDENTRNIILECASFDMYNIRRTAMAHGIFTDAVTRFNKGQSPLQNRAVATRIVDEIHKIAGGRVAGPVTDDIHLSAEVVDRNSLHPEVDVAATFINQRLGLQLDTADMVRLLQNVEFDVDTTSRTMVDETDGTKVDTDTLSVRAPFWRTDIEIPEDIVEEVGRLYGFSKLPLDLPLRDLTPARRYGLFELQSAIRAVLGSNGANELLSYSFVHGNLLERSGQDTKLAYRLSNALSPELQYYRLSLTPSLLDKVHANIKAGTDSFALYEIGKAHCAGLLDDEGLPRELPRLAFVYAANDKSASLLAGAPYYQAKNYLETVCARFILMPDMPLSYRPLSADGTAAEDTAYAQLIAPFEPNRSAAVLAGDAVIGVVGEYKASVRKHLKLPAYAAGFEIDLLALAAIRPPQYTQLSRYPKVEQDICLKVPASTSYQQVYDALADRLAANRPAETHAVLAPVDVFQRTDDPEHKQITLRYTITSYQKTMTDAEISQLLTSAAQAALDELHAEIV